MARLLGAVLGSTDRGGVAAGSCCALHLRDQWANAVKVLAGPRCPAELAD